MKTDTEGFALTPLREGFCMPAEWTKQEAIWLSWPTSQGIWPDRLHSIQELFSQIAAAISRFEKVRINAHNEYHPEILKLLKQECADMLAVELFDHPTNDVWCRDHGPIFVKQRVTGEVAVTDWKFNAWGGKFPPWDLDDKVPALVAESLDMRLFQSSMVLEGGAIDVNNNGILMTTSAVMLDPARNPGMRRSEVEGEIMNMLGVKQIFWLNEGIEGDDTGGHIDDLTRFVADDTLITMVEHDKKAMNYRALMENRERLDDLRTPSGGKMNIIEIPMPNPIKMQDWRLPLLPASYANFLIINDAVIVPVFSQRENDARAIGIIGDCFPGRKIVAIESTELIQEGGSIHCITQQQPAKGL